MLKNSPKTSLEIIQLLAGQRDKIVDIWEEFFLQAGLTGDHRLGLTGEDVVRMIAMAVMSHSVNDMSEVPDMVSTVSKTVRGKQHG